MGLVHTRELNVGLWLSWLNTFCYSLIWGLSVEVIQLLLFLKLLGGHIAPMIGIKTDGQIFEWAFGANAYLGVQHRICQFGMWHASMKIFICNHYIAITRTPEIEDKVTTKL